MLDDFVYYQFWDAFYSQLDEHNRFVRFFHMLLDPLRGLPGWRDRLIKLISVFKPYPWDGKKDGALAIAWSGEEFYDEKNIGRYDVNLVMRPTDVTKKIVCVPLFIQASYAENFWPQYAVPRPLAHKEHFCLFVVSNPRCEVRNRFFHRLSSSYKVVHSCGPSFNNTGVLAPKPRDEYFRFISQFRFMICFENTNRTAEYLTEKLHNAWLGGAIPIYWGASKALEWLNPEAFLWLDDDSDAGMDRLIARIAALDQDEEAYRAMHAQPLLRDGRIPTELSLEHIRDRIVEAMEPC